MKNKPIRKALSLLFALVMVVSCFASTASAASFLDSLTDSINKSMDQATDSMIDSMNKTSDSINRSIITATANPTPETPLTYSYTTPTIYCRDMYGRPSDRVTTVNFYLNEDAYKKGAEAIYTSTIGSGGYFSKNGTYYYSYEGNGKSTVTIKDLFSQKPPATLYFVVDPQPDTVYTPMNGTVYAQYAG